MGKAVNTQLRRLLILQRQRVMRLDLLNTSLCTIEKLNITRLYLNQVRGRNEVSERLCNATQFCPTIRRGGGLPDHCRKSSVFSRFLSYQHSPVWFLEA